MRAKSPLEIDCKKSEVADAPHSLLPARSTFWNLMAYDMAGSWDSLAGHQAPLFGPSPNVHEAVELYLSHGVAGAHKLVLGMPLYGRAFEHTDGPGCPYQGVGEGSWEAGSWDYKALPLPGSQEHFDPQAVAASCYDADKKKFVTYESMQSSLAKVRYMRDRGMKGAMWWELSGDREGEDSIVGRVAREMAPLDATPNHLEYPTSKWDNLREKRI